MQWTVRRGRGHGNGPRSRRRDHPDVIRRDHPDVIAPGVPVIGDEIKNNIHGLGRGGLGLAVGIVATTLGACGFARAIQEVANSIWDVPQERRPGFVPSWLRTFGLIAVMGLGVLSTTVLSGIGEWAGGTRFGTGARFILLG